MKKNSAKGNVRKGFVWDLAGTLIKQLSTVALSIVLARLLGPKDFGLIGMAMVFISLSEVFIDVGFTSSIIQSKSIVSKTLSSIFYVNLGISVLASATVYFCAPLISHYFENPELTPILRYLSIILPLYALGRVQAAIMAKEINFKSLAIRDIFATIIGGLVGITCAYKGFGVYSLVIQQISFACIGTILIWTGSQWRPKLEFSMAEIKKIMSFSTYVFFDSLLQQFFKKVDTLFVGKVFTPTTLGFYSRAESFNSLINNYSTSSLNKIIYPLLSALQDDKQKFEDTLAKSISLAVFLTSTIVGVLFFLADFLIILLLGPKWALSVVIFKILVFNTVALAINSILNKAVLSKGYSKLKFKVLIITRFLYLLSMPFGYYFGVEAFAIAFVAIRFVSVIINWIYFRKKLEVDLLKIIQSIAIPLFVLFTWVAIYYSNTLTISNNIFLLLFLTSYFTILYLFKNSGLFFVLNEIKKIKKRVF